MNYENKTKSNWLKCLLCSVTISLLGVSLNTWADDYGDAGYESVPAAEVAPQDTGDSMPDSDYDAEYDAPVSNQADDD